MIVTSVQIKTVKMQKHLYCPVFTLRSPETVRFRDFFFSVSAPPGAVRRIFSHNPAPARQTMGKR